MGLSWKPTYQVSFTPALAMATVRGTLYRFRFGVKVGYEFVSGLQINATYKVSATNMFDAYQRVWRGGILAMDLYGQFYSEQVPWALREELGSGSSRMRGYYAGRYMDTNQITAQLELRQHIYSRLGCVAWIGGGTVFPSFKELKLQHTLPNYGLGLRVEFKHNVNIRIDYGFGKDTAGFVFQFAEAF